MVAQSESQRRVWDKSLRLVGVGVLSGLGVGLAAAICARLLMRLIAVVLSHQPMFTSATFVLFRTGLFHGVLMGLLYISVRRLLPGGWLVKGAVFGILLFALALLPFVLPFVGELQGAPVLGTALFAILFLGTGIVEAGAVTWLERRLPAPRWRISSLLGYGLLVALAIYVAVSFTIGLVTLVQSGPFLQLVGSWRHGAGLL